MSVPEKPTIAVVSERMRSHVFVVSVAVVAAATSARALIWPGFDSDTMGLVWALSDLMRCIQESSDASCEGVSYFSLLQHIPALAAYSVTSGLGRIMRFLVLTNLVAVAAMTVAGFIVLYRREKAMGYVWLLAMVSSPMLYFATRSFSEGLAALAVAGLCMTVLVGGHPAAVGGLAFAAGLSKESAPAFAAVLGAAALVNRRATAPRGINPTAVALGVGLGLSVMANVAFNVMRYGTWANEFYSTDSLRVQDAATSAQFAIAAFVSPSGGILFYWPVLTLLMVITVAAADRRPGPYLVPLALVAYAVALSTWHAPFGWITWGNRLLLPWLPALCFLLLYSSQAPIRRGLQSLSSRPWLPLIAGGTLAAASIPQCLVLLDPTWMLDVFRPVPGCETMPSATNIAFYYQCMDRYLWPSVPTIARMFSNWTLTATASVVVFFYAAIFVAGVPLCVETASHDSTAV